MKLLQVVMLFLLSGLLLYGQTGTAISMATGVDNATAFGSNLTFGTDGTATFYLSWDATYIYFGWSGGRTNYSSDTYFVGVDTDPDGTNGNTADIMGATFNNTNSQKLDYWVYYENSSTVGGVPATDGNSFELWQNSSGSWSFVSRTAGDDNIESRVLFADAGGEVRLRIPWSSLSFSPGTTSNIGILMWTNNPDALFIWSSFPSSNPTGATPQQMLNYTVFPNTGSGVNTSSGGTETPLPVELTSFTASAQGSNVTLNWKTATELNNYGFEVERKALLNPSESGNSGEWKEIDLWKGTVTATRRKVIRLLIKIFPGAASFITG